MNVSVMITTRNRIGELRRTWRALQQLNPPPLEALITTDGCTEEVVAAVKAELPTARVFVNGALVGEHEGGHTAWRVDVTKALGPGGLVAVEIDNRPGLATIPGWAMRLERSGSVWYDWWHYGGIVRDVALVAQRKYGVLPPSCAPRARPASGRAGPRRGDGAGQHCTALSSAAGDSSRGRPSAGPGSRAPRRPPAT